jgi:hypothetical protein
MLRDVKMIQVATRRGQRQLDVLVRQLARKVGLAVSLEHPLSDQPQGYILETPESVPLDDVICDERPDAILPARAVAAPSIFTVA